MYDDWDDNDWDTPRWNQDAYDALRAAEDARREKALAHALRTDTRFAAAYALMGKDGLTWLQTPAGGITPDTWEGDRVRERFGITDDLAWLILSLELYLSGALQWCSLSGLGPSDEEPLGEYLEDSITAQGVLWLAQQGR